MKSENALWLPQNTGNFITELHDLISLFAHSKSWHVCDVVVSVDNNNYHVNNIYSNILLVCALFAIKKVEPTI